MARRVNVAVLLVLVGGAPVVLHVLAGRNRFGSAAWYWAYGGAALVGVVITVLRYRRRRGEGLSRTESLGRAVWQHHAVRERR